LGGSIPPLTISPIRGFVSDNLAREKVRSTRYKSVVGVSPLRRITFAEKD
jgi:hypothetical protein|tara:strand:+ start:3657 stop:3806 length:150 start_codon:yes stop_codon:yes gene_type:complete